MQELTKIFANIIHEVSKDSDLAFAINKGGCGVFAFNLASELYRLNIPYKVVYIDELCLDPFGDAQTIKSNLRKVDIGNSVRVATTHVMIKVNGFYVDGKYLDKQIPEEYEDDEVFEFKEKPKYLERAVKFWCMELYLYESKE